MSCHSIGRGMNSVVKVVISLVDERKIEIEPAKEIIEACKKGVNWCDGNEYEAIACIDGQRCGNCLVTIKDRENVVNADEVRESLDERYGLIVTDVLCDQCFKLLKS